MIPARSPRPLSAGMSETALTARFTPLVPTLTRVSKTSSGFRSSFIRIFSARRNSWNTYDTAMYPALKMHICCGICQGRQSPAGCSAERTQIAHARPASHGEAEGKRQEPGHHGERLIEGFGHFRRNYRQCDRESEDSVTQTFNAGNLHASPAEISLTTSV